MVLFLKCHLSNFSDTGEYLYQHPYVHTYVCGPLAKHHEELLPQPIYMSPTAVSVLGT